MQGVLGFGPEFTNPPKFAIGDQVLLRYLDGHFERGEVCDREGRQDGVWVYHIHLQSHRTVFEFEVNLKFDILDELARL